MTIPYALSVSHFINTVGADAGFAAIIGLAILVLLYFAQARETATLREQAAHAAERVAQLEYRLGQLTRGAPPAPSPAQTSVPAPAPRTTAQPVAAPAASRTLPPDRAPVPVAGVPAAPAGVGAPALASATRLIPGFDDGAISVRATGAPVGAAAGQTAAAAHGGGAAVMSPPGPPPATAAGGANGGGDRTAPPAPVAAVTAPPSTGGATPPRGPVRNGAARPPAPAPRRPSAPPPRSGARGLVIALAVLALVAVVVVALLILTSSGASTSSKSSSTTARTTSAAPGTTRHRSARSRGAIKPSSVTVAVLNGTATTNLAHDISVKLGSAGYKLGNVATATDQTQTATVVGYLSGQRKSALVVAKSLGLGPASVQPVDQSNQAVACPQAASCTAQVVVTVGSDLASAATTSTTGGGAATGGGTTTAAATT